MKIIIDALNYKNNESTELPSNAKIINSYFSEETSEWVFIYLVAREPEPKPSRFD